MIGNRLYSGSPYEKIAGYARAVIDGNIVYVSGTTGLDPVTGTFPPDAVEQTKIAFSTINKALSDAGSSLENMLRIRIYVKSCEIFDQIKPIIRDHCVAAQPANTTIVCDLVSEEMLVEIEVTACLGTMSEFN